MPDTNDETLLPVPIGAEANDVPGAMAAFRTALKPRLRYPATDEADRSARYAALPPYTEVYSTTTGTIWQKTGSGNTWRVVFDEPAAVTVPNAVFAAGWANGGTTYVMNGRIAHLNLIATYTGSTITIPSHGNISDIKVLDAPSAIRPVTPRAVAEWMGSTAGSASLYSSGGLWLTHALPGGSLDSGTTIYADFTVRVR